jgi:hypothetical protein
LIRPAEPMPPPSIKLVAATAPVRLTAPDETIDDVESLGMLILQSPANRTRLIRSYLRAVATSA